MTLAITAGQPDQQETTEFTPSLQHRVHGAIAAHTEFSLDRILTQDNRVKYAGTEKGQGSMEHLDEVFQLMRQLNEIGIESRSLGRLAENGRSFRDALRQICAQVAEAFAGRPLIYVELGPEPVKTGFILKTLREFGVMPDKYVAVDINPMSSAPMRAALEDILPQTQLTFVTSPFETFRLSDWVDGDGAAALITMLGFQEGNDDPFTVGGWLRAIARPGDFMLSESQLYTTGELTRISDFYAHPAMQRFSRIAFERAVDGSLPTLNRFFLLPVHFRDGQNAHVAILAEEFANALNGRNLHVSNFCLKLTLDQYRHYRQHGGFFEITGETFTDDQTLHFQLSRRI